ncbi:MAG: DUF1232 domain-containing protein [Sphingopyxis sp.]
MTLAQRIGDWAHALRRDATALWIAARSPDTPLGAKIVAAAVAAYAFSPIDLIPDFIPIIGMVDDMILVPLGIALALHLMPDALMTRFRAEAEIIDIRPRSWIVAGAIIALWLAVIMWLGWELTRYQ